MKRFISIMMIFVLVFSVIGCTDSGQDTSTEEGISFEPGIYTGTAEGHNGSLEVEVEFSEDSIVEINIVNSEETEHLVEPVFENVPEEIIEEQSIGFDSVSGATVTSMALKAAISDAIEQAGGNPDLLDKSSEEEAKSETIDLDTDVVVIGGGAAGLSAALSADQQGLSVVLLEKSAMLGGHSALSGAYTLVTGSELQKELGVTDDTPEKAYEDIMENGGEKCVPELLELYTEKMGEATDWTVDELGVEVPDELTPLGENKIDRALIYEGGGEGFISTLSERLEETDVELYLDTKATSLIRDGDDVIGVEADGKDGTKYTINAKSTVLATGGYGARKDLLPESLDNFVYYGASVASGDGLEMGEEVGADTVNMGYVELFENGVEWKPGIAKSTYNGSMAAWDVSGILVDRNGERVVNERGPGMEIVEQQSAQEDGTLFLFMDQATFDHFSDNIAGYGISQEMLDEWLENNGEVEPVFANGETIEEVAEIAEVDLKGLEETIEKYNGYVENGKDEDFDRASQYLNEKIGEGPYYLVEQKPRYATTLGGLLINNNLEVINTDGEPIKGLYATGDAAGGVRGDDSIPGSDFGWAVTSGYLIGDILNNGE